MIPMTMGWLQRRGSTRKRRAVLVALGGVVVGTVAAGAVYAWDDERVTADVERRTNELASTLRTGLATPVESLFSISAYLQIPREMGLSSQQFQTFCKPAIDRHPEIAGLEWFPLVDSAERATFEKFVGNEQPAFRITEPTRAGDMVAAVARDFHVPLTLMYPVVPPVSGLDLAFDPRRLAFVERALQTGQITLSDRFALVEDPPDVLSVAAYAPVTAAHWVPRDAGVPAFSRGVAVALFRLNPLVLSMVGGEHTQGIVFELWDPSAREEARLIHRSGSPPSEARQHSADIPFVDRTYRLVVYSTEPRGGWLPLLAFLFSAAGVWVTAGYLDARSRASRLLRKAQRLGQYQVESRIASGGMGTIYRARHALMRRPTAIKIANAEQAASIFEKEVLLTSSLTHPNTVMVYDFGRGENGTFYYAMEFIDGYDLEELVQMHGPVPAGRAIRLLLQACGALAEAHQRGLIHRDIKPSNLMVTERGGVRDFLKVLDFGLAKPQVAPSDVAASVSAGFAGTPGYLAPEVIAGRPASEVSDIFSLGAVAFYLVAGHGPFSQAKSVAEALTLALTRDPQVPADVPPALASVIVACLSREPQGRPRSMQALSERLRHAMEECPPWTAQDAERWWAAHPHPGRGVQSPTMKTFVPEGGRISSSLERTAS